MATAASEPRLKCLCFTITVEPALAEILLSLDKNIGAVMCAGLKAFLKRWIVTACVQELSAKEGMEVFVAISWHYVVCTTQLQNFLTEGMTNYLGSFFKDFGLTHGHDFTTAELALFTVKCVSG
ncbi:E4 ORF3 [Canine adenovirus 2]|uniref:E4 ORF3 n=3 Tax=Canine mastadenovirus A TaxID=10537 RepID=P87570_ADECT|nr:E4 ORFC [Canine adenovirus 2]AAB38737.1 E4 ORF3 [Canine adenovirus 2]QJS39042.1 E4 ORF3 [Canine adenovirus 2]UZP80975.1 E4 ORF3 [Canine adenovirus 2]BCG66253.1 E4 ORF C [Canine mastadenovirus A]